METNSVETLVGQICGSYGLVLIAFGTIGNILGAIICLQKKLRKVPTFVFLAFIQLVDVTTIYIWNIDSFINAFFGYRRLVTIESVLIISNWTQLSSYEASSWILVSNLL